MENITVNNVDITNLVTSFEVYEEMDKDLIIGSAVSTQIKLKLRNRDNQLEGLLDYPFIIGNKTYLVYEKPEKWTRSISLTLYDKMILTNIAYDTKLEYPVALSDQLDEISQIIGIAIDKATLSSQLLSKEVNWYDNTMIIRNYIMFIAQCDGKNAFIENDKIVFKGLAEQSHITDFCSDYELNELITFSRVCFDDGLNILAKGDTTGKTLYVSSNNSYIAQSDIDRIYSMYNGLSFYSFKKFKCKDVGVKLTDLLSYGDIIIMPLSIKKKVYGGEARDSVELSGDITIKNADSIIVKDDPLLRLRRVQTTVDQTNAKLEIVAQNVDHQTEILKNSINLSLQLNYVNNQTYDEVLNKYYPDYTTQPLKITAITKDILKEEVVHVVYVFKRKGQSDLDYVDLIDGETVVDNVLTVSHNLTESVEYKAYASVTVDDYTFTDEESITINLNTLSDTSIDGNVVQIEATADKFVEENGNYNPGNIVLTPKLFNCNFDLWSYSVDLGMNYENIIPIETVEDNDQQNTTNVVGIYFNNETNELQISNYAECFHLTNVVVFKLKADIEDATNTIVITKDSDIASQVNNIITEMNELKSEHTKVSQELDGLKGSITTSVESMETKYNGSITEINQQLSTIIQTSSSIEEQFKVLKETVEGNEGNLETLTTYIRKTAKGIEVGELEASVKTLMATSYFAILFNDEEVMKLEQNLLTIDRIKARSSFELGHSIFSVKDYGFDITWGGE